MTTTPEFAPTDRPIGAPAFSETQLAEEEGEEAAQEPLSHQGSVDHAPADRQSDSGAQVAERDPGRDEPTGTPAPSEVADPSVLGPDPVRADDPY